MAMQEKSRDEIAVVVPVGSTKAGIRSPTLIRSARSTNSVAAADDCCLAIRIRGSSRASRLASLAPWARVLCGQGDLRMLFVARWSRVGRCKHAGDPWRIEHIVA